MLAAFGKEHTALEMQIVRQRHENRVNIVHHRFVIGHDGRRISKRLCHILGMLGDNIANGRDLNAVHLVDVARMRPPSYGRSRSSPIGLFSFVLPP